MHTPAISLWEESIQVKPQTKFDYSNGLSHSHLPHTQGSTNTVPTLKVCQGAVNATRLTKTNTYALCKPMQLPIHQHTTAKIAINLPVTICPSESHHVCATVKRLCLWVLLLSSMRRSSRGELRGESRGEIEEGDRRCPLCLSGCSRFSRRIFTRSSFRPECLGMGGTARVSWWVTPMPACWAMPAPASPPTPALAKWMNSKGSQDISEIKQYTR